MDKFSFMVMAAQLQPNQALELYCNYANSVAWQKKYVVGHCGHSAEVLMAAFDKLSTRYTAEKFNLIEYGAGLLGSNECFVCGRPHGLGDYKKYNPPCLICSPSSPR